MAENETAPGAEADPASKDQPIDADAADDVEGESSEEEAQSDIAGNKKKKPGKTARKKQRQKLLKASGVEIKRSAAPIDVPPTLPVEAKRKQADIIVEYKYSAPQLQGEAAELFATIFEKFVPKFADEEAKAEDSAAEKEAVGDASDDDADSVGSGDAGVGGGDGISKKARKRQLQDMVAVLKREVEHPEVVESHDVTAPDARLLIHMKAYRNSVPVPRHWCQKRRYLQGKRGFIKPPFALPEFILQTGIAKMRDADGEATDGKTLKSRTRERARPKMGRIEIDYQVLHDAFFRYQTKPRMSHFGELYYEGKELEKVDRAAKPGVLSERLKQALGMTHAAMPPPWLLAQQRYGPPPSYPALKIAGLNAPLPPGASYGQGWGQWGYPPVDEYGQPLYGNPFAVVDPAAEEAEAAFRGAGAVKHHWGEPREEGGYAAFTGMYALEEELPAATGAEGGAGAQEAAGAGAGGSGTASTIPADGTTSVVSAVTSLASGMETPDVVDVRKGGRRGEETGGQLPSKAPALYTVLEQKETGLSGGLLATKHTYVLPGAGGEGGSVSLSSSIGVVGSGAGSGGVAVALAPEELGTLNEGELAARYEAEQARLAAQGKVDREDLSDLLEEHAAGKGGGGAGGGRKRKAAGEGDSEGNKRAKKAAKDFKF